MGWTLLATLVVLSRFEVAVHVRRAATREVMQAFDEMHIVDVCLDVPPPRLDTIVSMLPSRERKIKASLHSFADALPQLLRECGTGARFERFIGGIDARIDAGSGLQAGERLALSSTMYSH